ncbi:MAG: ATP-binding protein [Cyanobacteria bacterium P01_H01_bin.35]
MKIETENAASHISNKFELAHELLNFKAKSIAESSDFSAAVTNKNQQALLRILLPLQSSLELDLVKVIDSEGKVLSDLRSSAIGSIPLQDSKAIRLAKSGLIFKNLIVSEDSKTALVVEVISVKSREEIVGSLIVGYALTLEVLKDILNNRRQHLVLLKDAKIITSTILLDDSIQWSKITSQDILHKIKTGGESYFSKPVEIPEIADDRFKVVVLTPLASLYQSQWQMWLAIGSFALIGGSIISVFGFWVTSLVTRRITLLTTATQELAKGDLSVRLEFDSNDEISILATNFNEMSEQLKQRDLKIQAQLSELLQELQQTPELIQTEKMAGLGQMVAGIAHEINNPVSFIYSNVPHAKEYIDDLVNLVRLYQQHFPNPPSAILEEEEAIEIEFLIDDLSKILDSMKFGTERIREIVLSLRNFSRKDESEMKEVNIHHGLDSTLAILGHRLKAQSDRPAIEVVKDYGNLPFVNCFAGQLNQVFMNLLSNAIDALEDEIIKQNTKNCGDGVSLSLNISIKTDIKDNWVTIEIADHGSGIPEDIRNKLFDPFFTTKPVGKGTGLGLSISYQIVVEKHRGKLWCESQLGQGTKFFISIPVIKRGSGGVGE